MKTLCRSASVKEIRSDRCKAEGGGVMKKYLGFAAVCACLLISEPTFAEDTVFEIPGMSDEIEALIGSI